MKNKLEVTWRRAGSCDDEADTRTLASRLFCVSCFGGRSSAAKRVRTLQAMHLVDHSLNAVPLYVGQTVS